MSCRSHFHLKFIRNIMLRSKYLCVGNYVCIRKTKVSMKTQIVFLKNQTTQTTTSSSTVRFPPSPNTSNPPKSAPIFSQPTPPTIRSQTKPIYSQSSSARPNQDNAHLTNTSQSAALSPQATSPTLQIETGPIFPHTSPHLTATDPIQSLHKPHLSTTPQSQSNLPTIFLLASKSKTRLQSSLPLFPSSESPLKIARTAQFAK